MTFFSLLTTGIGCILWGAAIAIIMTVAVWLLCQVLDRAASPLTYVVLAILFVLNGAQATMMIGAMYGRGYVADMGEYVNSFVGQGENVTASINDFDNLRGQLENDFPMMKTVLDKIDTSKLRSYMEEGHSIVDFVTDELKSILNWYILRRILWMLGFMVTAVVAILFLSRRRDYSYDINSLETLY